MILLGAWPKHIQNIVMVPKNVSNAVINLVYGPQQKLRKKTDLGPSSVQHRVSWSGLSSLCRRDALTSHRCWLSLSVEVKRNYKIHQVSLITYQLVWVWLSVQCCLKLKQLWNICQKSVPENPSPENLSPENLCHKNLSKNLSETNSQKIIQEHDVHESW